MKYVIFLFMGALLLLPACNSKNEPELSQNSLLADTDTQIESTATMTVTATSTATNTSTPTPIATITASATVMATVLPTQELTVTTTPMSTPVPIMPVIPTIEVTSAYKVVRDVMPASNRDLLYLADGAFKRWNHETQQIETLVSGLDPSTRIRTSDNVHDDFVGDVVDFSVSDDGKWVAFVQLINLQETTEYKGPKLQYTLYFMDLVNQESWELVPRIDNFEGLSLSPDAQHVAFTGSSLSGDSVTDDGRFPTPQLYYLATSEGDLGGVKHVAKCERSCSEIVWHPTDKLFVYEGETALWLYHLSTDTSEMLVEHQIPDEYPGGRFYYPIAWANNGRFLLLSSFLSDVVIDVPTRVLIDVPNTYNYGAHFGIDMIWLPDSRLAVLRSNVDSSGDWSTLEIWRFHPEENEIVKEETVFLSEDDTGAQGLQYLENGRIGYALVDAGDDELDPDIGLYQIVSLNEFPIRMNTQAVPDSASDVLWAPDGSSALVLSSPYLPSGRRTYFGAAGGDKLVDITAILGAEAHAFHWQPEIVMP